MRRWIIRGTTSVWLVASVLAVAGCDDDTGPANIDDPTEDTFTETDGTTPDTAGDTAEPDTGELDTTEPTPDVGEPDVTPPPEPAITCQIRTQAGLAEFGPPSTLTYGAADEAAEYVQTPGFQVDFQAETVGIVGEASIELVNDDEVVATRPLVVDSEDHGAAGFTEVTIDAGAPRYFLRARFGDGQTVACEPTTIAFQTDKCDVAVDVGDGCITVDQNTELEGVQIAVTVTHTSGDCDEAAVSVDFGDGASELAAQPFDGTTSTFEVTVPESAVDGGQVTATGHARSAAYPSRNASSATDSATVDTVAPSVVIDSGAGPFGFAADLDQDPSNGIQVEVTGSVAGVSVFDAATVTVGGPDGEVVVSPSGEGASLAWKATLTLSTTGEHTVTATTADTCGNQGSFSQSVGIDLEQAVLAITTPTMGTTLWAKDDQAPQTETTYESVFQVSATNLSENAELTVRCGSPEPGAPRSVVGSLTVPAFDVSAFNVPVSLSDMQVQRCHVEDKGFNQAISADIEIQIALPGPSLSVLTPSEGTLQNSPQVQLGGSTKNLDGQAGGITVSQNGTPIGTVATAPVQNGGFNWTVWLTSDGTAGAETLADGTYTLTANIIDALGNNACEQPGADCSVTVMLDATAPIAAITAPGDWTINPDVMTDTSEADGFQTFVSVTVDEAGSEVCVYVNGGPIGCQVAMLPNTELVFPDATLLPGDNTIEAVATDTAGNVSTLVSSNPYLESDAPVVTFASPAPGASTVTGIIDVVVDVKSVEGEALFAAGVNLNVDGEPSGVTGTDNGDGTYSFDGVQLDGIGAHSLTASAAIPGSTGFSAPLVVRLKAEPTASVSTPVAASVFNLASALCKPGYSDCVIDAVCDTTDTDDGSQATVTVTCGASTETYTTTVENNGATFENVTFADGENCALACNIVDAGTGFAADSAPVAVSVDRTAPAFGAWLKPEASSLIFVDDEAPDAGFQYSPRLTVSGLEAGSTITVNVAFEGGETFDLEQTVDADVADDASTVVYMPQATWPQGIATLSASATDAAGNPTASFTKVVQVVSEQPLVRISQPANVAPDACTDHADCGAGVCASGQCALGWSSNSATTLSIKTKNTPPEVEAPEIRVCTDHPAAAGNAACEASGAGYYELARVPQTGDTTVVTLGAAAVDGVHTFRVEAKITNSGIWTSSLTASDAADRSRRVWIDTVVPAIATLSAPADVEAPTGCLNQAEGQGSFDIRTRCTKDGTVELKLAGQPAGTLSVEADTDATFAGVALSDGSHAFTAVCFDAVGNASPVATYNVDVDGTAPTVGVVQPLVGPILVGGDRDVVVASDEINAEVTLSDSVQGDLGTAVVQVDGNATFDHATYNTFATDGTHQLTATVSDACGNVATAQSATIEVDMTPPSVSVVAPTTGTALTDADDADPASGFQVIAQPGTGGDAANWSLWLESGCDASFANCNAPAQLATGAVTAPDGQEPAGTYTVPVFKTPDYVRVVARATDAAGNAVEAASNVTITLASCSLNLSGLPQNGVVSTAQCATPGEDCDSVTATVNVALVGACAGVQNVTLYDGETPLGSSAIADGAASFEVTLNHGATLNLDARSDETDAASGATTWTVDTKAPVAAFTSIDVNGFNTPATDGDYSYNRADDQGAGAGLQIPVRIDVTDDGFGDGEIQSITVDTGAGAADATASLAMPHALTGNADGVQVDSVTLPEATDATVTVTVTDSAGNTGTATFTYDADTVAPNALTLTSEVVSRRRPTLTVSWTEVGDDAAEGGAVAAYDVRYSLVPITEANFEDACRADNLLTAASFPTPGQPGEAQSYTITGPDARGSSYGENGQDCVWKTRADGATWYVAARAQDAAGNWGPVEAGSVTSTTDLSFRTTQFSITGTMAQDDFDERISAIGDVNNDGYSDFALGGFNVHGFCIFYGSDAETVPDITFDPTLFPVGPNWQCILDDTSSLSTRAGHVSKNIGDFNGDGLQDFAVPAGRSGSTYIPRELRIYFGVNGGMVNPVPSVVITGHAQTETSTTPRFDGGGNFNGDTVDHDANPETPEIAIADVLIGDRRSNRAFVVLGATSWTEGTTVDLSDPADIAAYNVVTFEMVNWASDPRFGNYIGFVGDILTDGDAARDDIFISAENPTENTQAFILRGRDVSAAATYTVSYNHDGTGTEDATSTRIKPDSGKNAFGSNIIGRRDVSGDGVPDLFVDHNKNSPWESLYYFDGQALRDGEGTTMTLDVEANPTGDGRYLSSTPGRGWSMTGAYANFAALGNITDNQAGTHDATAIGYVNYYTEGYGVAYVRLNTADAEGGLPYGSYAYLDYELTDPYAAEGDPNFAKYGSKDIRGVGDVNGDGLDDFVVGTDGSGYAVLYY